jgi:hypothetical protein
LYPFWKEQSAFISLLSTFELILFGQKASLLMLAYDQVKEFIM